MLASLFQGGVALRINLYYRCRSQCIIHGPMWSHSVVIGVHAIHWSRGKCARPPAGLHKSIKEIAFELVVLVRMLSFIAVGRRL